MDGNSPSGLIRRSRWVRYIRVRLGQDFFLMIVSLFAVLATAVLGPFAVYRALVGEWPAALGNVVTIAVVFGAVAYCWTTGRTEGARRLIAVFMGIACTYMVAIVGHVPYWVFPTAVANFMLVHWRFALTINTLMLIAVVIGGWPFFGDVVGMLGFVSAVTLVALFSMVFVTSTNFHRDRLSELVSRDALTGALNRRLLREDVSDALSRADRLGQPAALALLDLDNFKQINDRHGHEVGDQVLIDLTRIVEAQCRQSDRFYRLGGEEFVLLLNHTDYSGAVVAVDKLIEAIRTQLRGPAGPVTVSIGVAVLRSGESWSDWLSRADQAMYRAKGAGKDQVVFADSKA